jgi:hypothetical protein
MVTIKNTNAEGRMSMALKVGDTYIMPGQEVALEELSAPIEIGTVSNFRVSAEKKKQEMIEKAEAKKKEKEEAKANRSTGAEYVFDPWQKNPCCVCPPCARKATGSTRESVFE